MWKSFFSKNSKPLFNNMSGNRGSFGFGFGRSFAFLHWRIFGRRMGRFPFSWFRFWFHHFEVVLGIKKAINFFLNIFVFEDTFGSLNVSLRRGGCLFFVKILIFVFRFRLDVCKFFSDLVSKFVFFFNSVFPIKCSRRLSKTVPKAT